MYADDACLNVKAPIINLLETLMNQKMEITRQWMLANKLTINVSKTKAMVIPPKKKLMFDYSINSKMWDVTDLCTTKRQISRPEYWR